MTAADRPDSLPSARRFRQHLMVSFPRPTNRYTQSPSLAEARSRQGGVFARIRRSPFAADVRRFIQAPTSTRFGLLLVMACMGGISAAIALSTRGMAWVAQ